MDDNNFIITNITYFGHPAIVQCDGNCSKAWGINNRPKEQLSDDEDDYVYLSDGELPDAPADPGTYEGECAKPLERPEKHNKWCVRECERSELSSINGEIPVLKDWSERVFNKKQDEPTGGEEA